APREKVYKSVGLFSPGIQRPRAEVRGGLKKLAKLAMSLFSVCNFFMHCSFGSAPTLPTVRKNWQCGQRALRPVRVGLVFSPTIRAMRSRFRRTGGTLFLKWLVRGSSASAK